MGEPPYYQTGILHGIESTIVELREEFPRMTDDDIELAYVKLSKYFKSRAGGKMLEEPEVSSERKQAIIDEILNILEIRAEQGLDAGFINKADVLHGEHKIASLEYLYTTCFKRLLDSLRFWRKKDGRKGYINYISHFL